MDELDERALDQVATFFSAFAVPTRLRILNTLRLGERNVGDLAQALGTSQANISKHLALLARLGVIAKRARGTSAYYHIVDPRVFDLCDLVCAQVGRRLTSEIAARDALLRSARPRTPRRARPSRP